MTPQIIASHSTAANFRTCGERAATNWEYISTQTAWYSFRPPLNGEVGYMKVRSTKALMIISDFIMGALLITAPWLFGIARGDIVSWMAVGIGGYTIIYSLLTCYEHMSAIVDQEFRTRVVRVGNT